MKYQDCADAMQAGEASAEGEAGGSTSLTEANINPRTRLATDYLNHFNEAIMLLDMLSSTPDCVSDFLAWQPKTYREHFLVSGLRHRNLTVSAYETAEPSARDCLDVLAVTMTSVLEAARSAMLSGLPQPTMQKLAQNTVTALKPLIARAGAVINGETETQTDHFSTPQMVVDHLLNR